MADKDADSLAEKLDRDLDEFIKEKLANPSGPMMNDDFLDMDPTTLANELKQHPAFMTEFDESKPLSPAMQGLQALKYESDSADLNASSYKEDGNKNFKLKKYRWAIDNYTAGIKELSKDRELNAILYTNRAAANFHIGNIRSSLNDVIYARKFKPDHMKAIFRGCLCCFELNKFDACLKWCDDALLIDGSDAKVLELRTKAENQKKKLERDRRKQQAMERKKQAAEQKLIGAIKERGITLEKPAKNEDGEEPSILASLEAHHPSGAQVRVCDDGSLSWPVYFLYPEFGETDFIEAFSENARFEDHLEAMFGASVEPPGWDPEKKYNPGSIRILFEDRDKNKLHEVKKSSNLLTILKKSQFTVRGGTPSFILLVRGSKFEKEFCSKYS